MNDNSFEVSIELGGIMLGVVSFDPRRQQGLIILARLGQELTSIWQQQGWQNDMTVAIEALALLLAEIVFFENRLGHLFMH